MKIGAVGNDIGSRSTIIAAVLTQGVEIIPKDGDYFIQ
jgi:hypothetical protein